MLYKVGNNQLAIHVSRSSVQVAELLRSNQSIIRQASFELLESSGDGYRTKLQEIFTNLNWGDDFSEFTMAWATPKQTLVPLKVFNASTEKDIFRLMFGEGIDESTIDFNRLMELNTVSVYEIPDWVKSFFIIKYPHLIFKHEHAMTLRALFQKSTFKRIVNITLNDQYINIFVIYHNNLQFSNSFEYQTVEDVIYHLMFVVKQENITQEEGTINFYFTNEKSEKMAHETKTKLEELKPFKKLKIDSIDSVLKLQVLCV